MRSSSSRGSSSGLRLAAVRTSSPKSESTEPSITVSRSITQSASPVPASSSRLFSLQSWCITRRGAAPGSAAPSRRRRSRVGRAGRLDLVAHTGGAPTGIVCHGRLEVGEASPQIVEARDRDGERGRRQIREQSRELREGARRLEGFRGPGDDLAGDGALDHQIGPPDAPVGGDPEGRAVAGRDERQHAALEVAHPPAREAGAQMRRHARDVAHHRDRIREDAGVDPLLDVPHALAAALPGRDEALVDVATAEGLGVPEASGDRESLPDRAQLVRHRSRRSVRLRLSCTRSPSGSPRPAAWRGRPRSPRRA